MRNRYEIRGDIVAITLRRKEKEPLEATVSIRHLPKLRAVDVRWYAKPHHSMDYVVVGRFRHRKQLIQLNRFIMDFPEGRFVIHDDGNPLNNTDENLLVLPYNSSEVFAPASRLPIGVHYVPHSGKWLAVGMVNKTKREIGYYRTKEEADTALIQLDAYWKKYASF